MKKKLLGSRKGETKRCRFCKSTKRKLMIHCNPTKTCKRTYYSCKPCQADRKSKWYANGNKKKQQIYNNNYLAKKKNENN